MIWLWILPAFLACIGIMIGVLRFDGWLIIKSITVFTGAIVVAELASWANMYF